MTLLIDSFDVLLQGSVVTTPERTEYIFCYIQSKALSGENDHTYGMDAKKRDGIKGELYDR